MSKYCEAMGLRLLSRVKEVKGTCSPNRPSGFMATHQTAGKLSLGAAMQRGLPVFTLRYAWDMHDGLPDGPYWEMVFKQPAT